MHFLYLKLYGSIDCFKYFFCGMLLLVLHRLYNKRRKKYE